MEKKEEEIQFDDPNDTLGDFNPLADAFGSGAGAPDMDGTIPDFMGGEGDDVLFLPDMSNIEDGVFPDEK